MQELADRFDESQASGTPCYMDAEEIADIIDWLAVNRRYDKASELVEYGLKIHPGSTPILVEKAYLYLDMQDRPSAKKVLKQIVEDIPEVKILRANFLLAEEKVEEAEALIDQIEDKDDLYNIIDVVYMYLDNGFPEKALTWIERNVERYADEESFQAVTADCYYSLRELEKSEEFYNKLIDKNPYSAPYWFGLARCQLDMGVMDKAIESCDYAIISDEEFTEAYIVRGHAYFHLGNNEMALENYTKAHEMGGLSQSFLDTYVGLGKYDEKQWEESIFYMKRAVENKAPDDNSIYPPILYANIALSYFRTGNSSKAHQYCQKAIKEAPEQPDAYLIEGFIYMSEDNSEKGAALWARAVKYSNTSYVWNEIAEYCLELLQLPTASLAFERVKELDPDYPNINERLAATYLSLGEQEKFLKYNQMSDTPIRLEEVEVLINEMERGDQDQKRMAEMLRNIAKAMKEQAKK